MLIFLCFQQAGSLTVIFIHALDILLTYVSSFSTLLWSLAGLAEEAPHLVLVKT